MPDNKQWCIVGLGNPGREYSNTRHNLGFMVVNELAKQNKITWRYKNKYSFCTCPQLQFLLVRPLTYMNLSGQAVKQVLAERNISLEKLIIICDDINLPLGQLRLRFSGSDGGQKGLRSIIDTLKTDNIARLRLGIGPRPPSDKTSDFVLGKFTAQEYVLSREMANQATEAINKIINHGLEKAMNSINQKNT